MAVNIKLKRSAVPGNIPTTSSLELGELALNTYDGKVFLKKQVGSVQTVVELISSGGTIPSASYANYAAIAGYALTADAANTALNANNATSASYSAYASNASSASYAVTASYVLNTGNASSASYAVSASYATTASYAANIPLTASWATNAVTASSADDLLVRGTLTARTIVVQYVTSSQELVTGSLTVSGSLNAVGGITGSLAGTASWSAFATSASRALNANTASYTQLAASSSYALTASYAASTSNATSASFATNAANATSASIATNAITASYIINAASASYALSASYAASASISTTASLAVNAVSSSYSNFASTATTASFATNAANASSASYALSSSYSTASAFATSASYALNASNATSASIAALAVTASYALNAPTAISSSYATNAATASSADNFIVRGNLTALSITSSAFSGDGSGLTNVGSIEKVYYVAEDGLDTNDGKTLSSPFRTIKAAITAASASLSANVTTPVYRQSIQVKSGYYTEIAPITVPSNVSILGDDLRSVVVKPTTATSGSNLFLMNNGTFCWGLRLEGCAIDNLEDPRNGFFFAFAPNAYIVTSPYIQNCSAIHTPADKFYTPLDSGSNPPNPLVGNGPGGMIIDDSVLNGYSPLKSMIVDSYTQVAFNGIGVCVRGAGYAQMVSFFTNFSRVGTYCIEGGHASLLNSNTTFGDYGLRSKGLRMLVKPNIIGVSSSLDVSLVTKT